MSESRLMQILASLARRSPLRTLHTICETQHQISTRKLEQYLEPIGDELAGFAFNLRQDYDALRKELDTLRTANQRLEGEVARLKAALDEAAQDIAEWGAYASDYFQEKHGLDGCIAKYAALAGDGGDV